MDYLIEFEAHIDERKRPEAFPHSVFIKETYVGVQTEEELKQIFNTRFKSIITQPGIVVLPDDQHVELGKLNFNQRVYVPWHMITHFHGRVAIITQSNEIMPQEPVLDEKEKKIVPS